MRTMRTMNRCPYVIIGNSVAAMGAVAGIREVDPDRPITIVAREPHHTYSRPLISYLLGGKIDESRMLYRPADFYEENNVRAILGVEATGVDTEAQTVQTAAGESLVFEKLLIATGGRPIVPHDIAGTDAEGVFTFTTWDDACNIKAFIADHTVQEAVVVGGGLIGLKSVEALVTLGIKTTVVELADRILSATFDRTASDLAQQALEDGGVQVHCNNTVAEIGKRGEMNIARGSAMIRDAIRAVADVEERISTDETEDGDEARDARARPLKRAEREWLWKALSQRGRNLVSSEYDKLTEPATADEEGNG